MDFQSDADNFDEAPYKTTSLQSQPKKTTQPDANTSRSCSICEQPFEPALSPCLPFCSIRCQQIDLRRWMTESYSLPMDGQEDLEHQDLEENA